MWTDGHDIPIIYSFHTFVQRIPYTITSKQESKVIYCTGDNLSTIKCLKEIA